MGKFLGYTALIMLAALIAAGCFLGYFLLEGSPPELQVVSVPETVGSEYVLTVEVKDARSGIRSISAVLSQGDMVFELDPKIYKIKNRRGELLHRIHSYNTESIVINKRYKLVESISELEEGMTYFVLFHIYVNY